MTNDEAETEIISLHYQLRRTQLILDSLVSKGTEVNNTDLAYATERAFEFVKKRFPDLTIGLRPRSTA